MSFQNKVEYFFFIVFVRFFNIFGYDKAKMFAKPLAFIFFYLIPIRKNTVVDNLKTAFPEYSNEKINELAFKCYQSFIITFIEIACIPSLSVEKLKRTMTCTEIDLLRKIYSKGKGLIFLTAHFGNWELSAISMSAYLNLPMCVVAKDQRNPYVSEWLNMMREKFGNRVTLLGASIKNIYKELLNKSVLGIVGDQRGPKEGLRVKFFGKSTAVYPGTASMAVKTGAPIAVAMMIRQPDYIYKLFIEIIDPETLTGTEEEKIFKINQRYFSILENLIRKYPEQWLWMHKIWKY